MKRNYYFAVIGALCVLSCWLFYQNERLKEEMVEIMLLAEVNAAVSETPEPEEQMVTFYICGEVANPEIYKLPLGSRVIDAIEIAGGATEYAALDMLESPAGEIEDGQKIYVPNVDDDIDKINYMNNNVISWSQTRSVTKDPNAVININTASVRELCKLQGIGEATAQLICDYREENGDFVMIEDIKNVSGIGEKTFESIKNNITVGDTVNGG